LKKIVFLYTELAEYFLACLALLEKQNAEIHVVHWPLNKEAPFHFRKLEHTEFHDRSLLNDGGLKKLVDEINPTIIFCSGWVDKGYNRICKSWRKRIPTVVLLDNHWTGNWKQWIASTMSAIVVRDKFSHAWVPGKPQIEFALRLGFTDEQIRTGYYCADTALFHEIYYKSLASKQLSMPKRFLYVGRYLPFKGVLDLWKAFAEANEKFPQWDLWCIGTGDLWEQRLIHPCIRHIGFVQPAALSEFISQCSVFVLPSSKEPWGVVVQEMAAAGLPLVCSNKVGAANQFLEEGKNGFTHEAGNIHALKNSLLKMMSLPEEKLHAMSRYSFLLSNSVTQEKWVHTAMGFLD